MPDGHDEHFRPREMKEWIEARVAEGAHAGTSDYLRDLVRRDQVRRQAQASLDKAVQAAYYSGAPIELDEAALLREIKAKRQN